MEILGLLAAMLSSALGGTAVGATRYLADALDPIAMGAMRFGGGLLVLAPILYWRGERWRARRDWPGATALGLLFFGLFPVLFNAALIYTTAARGALALSTVPLLTMAAGAFLGRESPTTRKAVGVTIAMAGVVTALAGSLSGAPQGAWRGDLLMLGAAGCMAIYNVMSRPYIARYGPIAFAGFGMGIGAVCLAAICLARDGLSEIVALGAMQWLAIGYLAVVGGALVFFLWAYALGRTAPTLVAVSVAVNPVTASLFGVFLLDETVTANLVLGLAAVLVGIAIASGVRVWPRRGT